MNTTKRLNIQLSPEVDAKLRRIAAVTGLKLVTVLSKGIEYVARDMDVKKEGK